MKITNPNCVSFDIDDTIVNWCDYESGKPKVTIKTPWDTEVTLTFNPWVVDKLKQHHAQGHFITLHSQSGADWCESVAIALDINSLISLYISKPKWYYDDLDANAWMTRVVPK